MDYRLFLVGFPFLIALLFTLISLINWEIKDNLNSNNGTIIDNQADLNLSNGFINQTFLSEKNKEIHIDKFILNIIIIPSFLFLILIFYTVYK